MLAGLEVCWTPCQKGPCWLSIPDILDFVVYQGILLYVHYRRENVKLFFMRSIFELTHSSLRAGCIPSECNWISNSIELARLNSMSGKLPTQSADLRREYLWHSIWEILNSLSSYVFHDKYSQLIGPCDDSDALWAQVRVPLNTARMYDLIVEALPKFTTGI